jgi:competence protein ComEC
MMNALEEKDIEYQYLYANLEVPWDEEVEVRVLSPVQGVNYGAIINNYSIMLHITYGETSMLLAGDAEKKAEQKVLETFESIQADVLKAGHHGSDTSSTRDFIEAVSPELVIISVGADNKYDHPSKKTMDLFEELGIQVMRTDLDGTIHLIFSGLGYKVAEELEEVEE